jgi:sugar (pentulose or hexulose) kinase
MKKTELRGIVVVDVGYTNTKAILFSPDLKIVAERKIPSVHRDGSDYKIIDARPVFSFLEKALPELDAILPVDVIVPSAHGACLAALKADGALAMPVMDYASQPPEDIIAAYKKIEPPFNEVYCTLLPMALTHGLQLYWQRHLSPSKFSDVKTILPWIQYIAFGLSGVLASEISSMACQSQLIDVNTTKPSTLALLQGWGQHYAPLRKAWDRLGLLQASYRGEAFRGQAQVLAGVHDSSANYLRYLAAGLENFTLVSTGTWIISFNSSADVSKLDHTKDTNTNTDVFGRRVACSRFFGGKELEVLSQGAEVGLAHLALVQELVSAGVMALPSFTDSGGPFPGTGNKGRIAGGAINSPERRASLAALYCAIMVSAQLDAVDCRAQIIVDGPFAKHEVFLAILAQLRSGQKLFASDLRDGTAAGAACLALMESGELPKIELSLSEVKASTIEGLDSYHSHWRKAAAHV